MRPLNLRRNPFLAVIFCLALSPARFHAAEVAGRVVALNDGAALSQAMVTLTLPKKTVGPSAVTVFTGADGTFRIPLPSAAKLSGTQLEVHKLGFRQVRPVPGAAPGATGKSGAGKDARIYMEAVANIAADVPASAWLSSAPASEAKNITLLACSNCHQFPSARVREYAEKIEAVRGGPEGDRKALEAWRTVVRHAAWRDVVKDMRAKHYIFFPMESAIGLSTPDWPTSTDADYNLFNGRHGDIAAEYLANNFPRTTAALHPDDYDYGAPLGVTARTVIREFAFPAESVVRELIPLDGSPYLWGTDVRRNVVVRLDPENGAVKDIHVPYKGTTGPHTIIPDDDGNLWVSMVDNAQFGRLNPKTEQWTLWTLRPPNLPDSEWLAGAALVHDMAIDERGHLERDAYGQLWVTLSGTNQMGTLDTKTGLVAFHEVNKIEGMSRTNTLIYSVILSPDRKHVWYSQINGHVGCLNAETKKIEKIIPFAEGSGPRRMWRDKLGNLWVALNGSSQIAKIDMASGTLTATYDLPNRSAAPYAVIWDDRRNAVWVANGNSDAIYRFDPVSATFKVYPLPRKGAYLRTIGIDHTSGKLVVTYANYVPAAAAPRMGALIDVGD